MPSKGLPYLIEDDAEALRRGDLGLVESYPPELIALGLAECG